MELWTLRVHTSPVRYSPSLSLSLLQLSQQLFKLVKLPFTLLSPSIILTLLFKYGGMTEQTAPLLKDR